MIDWAPTSGTPCAFKNCRGFYHSGTAETGVVLCPPWGLEELATREAWRGLASSIAQAGYPCLRFDYPGTGHSLGSMESATEIGQWVEAACAAAAFLQAYSGAKKLVFLGLTLGAAIAMEAASRHFYKVEEAASLILITPIARGAAYVGGLSAWAGPLPNGAGLDQAGYVLGPRMAASLKEFDALKCSLGRITDVTVFDHAGRKVGAEVSEHYRRLGLDPKFEVIAAPDRLDAVPDTISLPVPAESVVAALRRIAPQIVSSAKPARTPLLPATLRAASYREEPLAPRNDVPVRGTLCLPAQPQVKAPVVVFLDAGLTRDGNWRRMGIDLTRALAAYGITCLRLDSDGLDQASVALCLRHTVEALAARGTHGITVVGMGETASTALLAARDSRITHVVAIDMLHLEAEDAAAGSTLAERVLTLASGRNERRLGTNPYAEKIPFFDDLAEAVARRKPASLRAMLDAKLSGSYRKFTAALSPKLRSLLLRDARPGRIHAVFSELSRGNTRISLVFSGAAEALNDLASHSGRRGQMRNERGLSVHFLPDLDGDPASPNSASWLLDHMLDVALPQATEAGTERHAA